MRSALKTLACLLLLAGRLDAELVLYQGKLSVEGTAFSGTGRFKFAVIGDDGAAVWSSEAISLNVDKGVYAVRLGDSAQAPPIDGAMLRGVSAPKLRIWFERTEKGWSVVGADVPLKGDKRSRAATEANQSAAILEELREIRLLLEGNPGGARTQPAGPVTVTVPMAGAPSLGKADAPLVLVEFTDFQCDYSGKFQREVFDALKTKHVDTGKLRFVSRNLPLAMHPQAVPAAKAALCAEAQGKYRAMRERLFAANGVLSPEAIQQAAREAGLDAAKFEACLNGAETAAALEKDAQDASAAGITVTPIFVLGTLSGDKVTGVKIIGAQSLARFEAEMERVLSGKK